MNRESSLLSRVIAAGALVVMVLGASQYGVKIKGVNVSPVDPLIWALFAVWIVDRARCRTLCSIVPPPAAVMLLIAASVLSGVGAVNRLEVAKEALQWVEYFGLAFVLFAAQGRESRMFRTMVRVFLILTTAIVVWAFVQYLDRSIDPFKVRAGFGNRNILGGFLSISLPLAFSLLLTDARWGARLWLAVTLAIGATVVLSGGTYLGVSVALLGIAVVRGRLAFAATAAALLVWTCFVTPHLPRENSRIMTESVSLFGENGDPTPRCTEWQAALSMWQENRMVGVGAGNYQSNIGRYYGYLPRPNRNLTEPDSHNLYLVLMSSVGLVGLMAFIAVLAVFAGKAASTAARAADPWIRSVALGALGSLTAFSINGVWSGLLVRGLGIPLALVLGLIAAAYESNTRPAWDVT